MSKTTLRWIRPVLVLLLDLAAATLAFVGILGFFVPLGGSGFMTSEGAGCFRYFTVDSNLLLLLVSLFHAGLMGWKIFRPDWEVPEWVTIVHFVGVVATTVTFLTVICFLGPTQGWGMMYLGTSLYLHALAPIAGILALLLSPGNMRTRFAPLGLSTVILYGIVYLVMVVALGPLNGGWEDFYGLNRGGYWPIALLAMFAATAAISYGLHYLRKLVGKLISRD